MLLLVLLNVVPFAYRCSALQKSKYRYIDTHSSQCVCDFFPTTFIFLCYLCDFGKVFGLLNSLLYN